MKNLKNKITLILAALVLTSTMTMNVVAADGDTVGGHAGIEFKTGGTTIEPPNPDGDLPEIKSRDIHFGEQSISADTKTYRSIANEKESDTQYAGFIVSAGNDEGWSVTVQISDFELNGKKTMKNFTLNLNPDEAKTTTGNLGEAPTPNPAVNMAGPNGDSKPYGDAHTIFVAEDGEGLGKWGCNWEGILKVVGGSVDEVGNASATMLWTLVMGSVNTDA